MGAMVRGIVSITVITALDGASTQEMSPGLGRKTDKEQTNKLNSPTVGWFGFSKSVLTGRVGRAVSWSLAWAGVLDS